MTYTLSRKVLEGTDPSDAPEMGPSSTCPLIPKEITG